MFNVIFTILILQTIDAIDLNCEFKTLNPFWEVQYSCTPKNLRTTFRDRNIVAVNGVHVSGKSNKGVIKLYIYKQFCPYLPLKIGNYFPNLEILDAGNTKLKHLLDGDLDGLTKLKRFDVSWNPIEKLSRDFFKGHETIEFVSFFYCHLKVIDPQALEPLTNLQEAHFGDNICITYHSTDTFEIQGLNMEIRDKCKSELYEGKIFNDIEDETPCETLSFTKQNVYFIASLFATISFILLVVLARVFTNKFGSNWNELHEVLV